MADRFWKSGPAALRKPAIDELYKRLRDLDYTQADERLAVMRNAILQLEGQVECRESASEAVLMVGLHLGWNLESGADQMAILEHGRRRERIRSFEESWIE